MQLRSRITVAAAALAVIVPLVVIQGSQSTSASTPIRCGTQFSVWPCLQAVSNSTKIIGVTYWAHNPQSVPEPGPSLNGNWYHLELVGPGGGHLQNSSGGITLAAGANTRAFTWTAPIHGSGGWGFYCANLWLDWYDGSLHWHHTLVANRCVDDQP